VPLDRRFAPARGEVNFYMAERNVPHPERAEGAVEGRTLAVQAVGALLAAAADRLVKAGIDNAYREARLLLALALGAGANAMLLPDRTVPAEAARQLQVFVERRASHEPYARIAGRREFWSREFLLSPDTLDPRPDSETLVEAALARIPDRTAALDILDFGTGTGALLLALLSELPNARGTGIDLVPGAVEMARRNAVALGLSAQAGFAVGHWGAGVTVPVDVILANPPYIPTGQLATLAPEVTRNDPLRALDGGADGLQAYRELAPDAVRLLRPTGFFVAEIGAWQGAAVARIMADAGLGTVEKRRDLAGIERCLVFEQRKKVGKS
jgi:release factor glutamine methyltransferase